MIQVVSTVYPENDVCFLSLPCQEQTWRSCVCMSVYVCMHMNRGALCPHKFSRAVHTNKQKRDSFAKEMWAEPFLTPSSSAMGHHTQIFNREPTGMGHGPASSPRLSLAWKCGSISENSTAPRASCSCLQSQAAVVWSKAPLINLIKKPLPVSAMNQNTASPCTLCLADLLGVQVANCQHYYPACPPGLTLSLLLPLSLPSSSHPSLRIAVSLWSQLYLRPVGVQRTLKRF